MLVVVWDGMLLYYKFQSKAVTKTKNNFNKVKHLEEINQHSASLKKLSP